MNEQRQSYLVSRSREYDMLPQPIKDRYSLDQFLWMPVWMKRKLVQMETEPDVE